MKKFIATGIGVCLLFLSCQTEQFDVDINAENAAKKSKVKVVENVIKSSECMVIDADRCPFGDQQPTSNFWWSKTQDVSDYFNRETYFSSTDAHKLVFTKYDNGTAKITGTTINTLGCIVTVDVKLIDMKTWGQWSAEGGGHKKEGCAGDASNSEDMVFYVIDSENSSIVASNCGDDNGTYGVEQRPDPLTDNAKFGSHFGPGGANYDSNIGAIGLSSWAYLTDPSTGERLWKVDFNFRVACTSSTCDTAYAKGTGDETVCFIGDAILDQGTNANRWGWRMGPLSEGTYTYNVYAGAGQCNINNGYLVGTVEINYSGGTVTAKYDLIDGFTMTEEHLYAGAAPYPIKNGSYTLAPGQMKVGKNLSGPIYVIAHSEVCSAVPN